MHQVDFYGKPIYSGLKSKKWCGLPLEMKKDQKMKYSLQNKRGYYHAVISYKDENGKRRLKSITTKVKVQKGNKRIAEKTADDLVSAWMKQREQDAEEKKDPPLSRAVEMFNEEKRKTVQPSTYVS